MCSGDKCGRRLAEHHEIAHYAGIGRFDEVRGMTSRQPDLFETEEQTDLFGEGFETPEYRPDPDSVRLDLQKMLAEVRAAQKLTWEPSKLLFYRTIFPQMTNWLSDEEGSQLRFEFETELKRLQAA
ncbi:hypothetical protein ACQR1V_14700 [Bradyrhizobium oligotrophicum]|uniref:hypothetical protein n=1 Tax=Bradyrhizobium TaxID=374 RepID=UPI0029160556|nr:hypothetical protein [Bradyrhizobium sp. SZCCHNR3003]